MSEKLRLRFSKTGRAVYISHLDLMRTMQRAFSRAGYELKYSEGYNPHPLISILLPLSVGTGSRCELMDFRLKGEAELSRLPGELTAALPEGIRAEAAYVLQRKGAELKWLEIEGELEYDRGDPAGMVPGLEAFFAAGSVPVRRKTKRGEGEADIRPAIRELRFEAGEGLVKLRGLISAQEPTLNPELLIEALRQGRPELAPDFARFTRLETYDGQMAVFR